MASGAGPRVNVGLGPPLIRMESFLLTVSTESIYTGHNTILCVSKFNTVVSSCRPEHLLVAMFGTLRFSRQSKVIRAWLF